MDEENLQAIHLTNRARYIGFVPQIHEPVFTYSVYQVVLMGRAPYLSHFRSPQKDDHKKVAQMLEYLGLWDLRHRPYTRISGGEQRLTLIARGMAQGAQYQLMDEPDAHLDPHHQHDVFTRIVNLAHEGFTFAISSHNPNNAILYANYVTLFSAGKLIAQGPPQETITPEILQQTYNMQFETLSDRSGLRAIVPTIKDDAQS
jgi:iron complex transport system ATP-binding protein